MRRSILLIPRPILSPSAWARIHDRRDRGDSRQARTSTTFATCSESPMPSARRIQETAGIKRFMPQPKGNRQSAIRTLLTVVLRSNNAPLKHAQAHRFSHADDGSCVVLHPLKRRADGHARGSHPAHSHLETNSTTPADWSNSTATRPSSATRLGSRIARGDGLLLRSASLHAQGPSHLQGANPGFQVIKDSVTIMRVLRRLHLLPDHHHQGYASSTAQQRPRSSARWPSWGDLKDFKGVISDLGGPTPTCTKSLRSPGDIEAICRRLSCVHPRFACCWGTDHSPLIELRRETRRQSKHPQGPWPVIKVHGPRAAVTGVHAGTGGASRRRTFEGRPGTYRSPPLPGNDEAAGSRERSSILTAGSAPLRKRRRRSNTSFPILSPPIPAVTSVL